MQIAVHWLLIRLILFVISDEQKVTQLRQHISGTPEAVYFRRFLRAYFSQPVRANYPTLPTDLIGWEKYARRNPRN